MWCFCVETAIEMAKHELLIMLEIFVLFHCLLLGLWCVSAHSNEDKIHNSPRFVRNSLADQIKLKNKKTQTFRSVNVIVDDMFGKVPSFLVMSQQALKTKIAIENICNGTTAANELT